MWPERDRPTAHTLHIYTYIHTHTEFTHSHTKCMETSQRSYPYRDRRYIPALIDRRYIPALIRTEYRDRPPRRRFEHTLHITCIHPGRLFEKWVRRCRRPCTRQARQTEYMHIHVPAARQTHRHRRERERGKDRIICLYMKGKGKNQKLAHVHVFPPGRRVRAQKTMQMSLREK